MTLPENFNDWDHATDVFRQVYNKEVRNEFRDIEDDDDISIGRASLKRACLIVENDNEAMICSKMLFFYCTLRKAQDLQQPMYGMSIQAHDEVRKYKPIIRLHFREDLEDVDTDKRAVWSQISFRIMNETSETITETKLRNYGNRIRTELGGGSRYVWKKGKDLISYLDKPNGIDLRLLCRDKTEGEEVIRKVCDVADKTYKPECQNYKVNEAPNIAYPQSQGTMRVLNKTIREPRIRPNVDVRFQYATAHVWGLDKPIPIYDANFLFRDTLVN